MSRSIAIGLGAALVGVVGTILLDRLTHGVLHTILTIIMIALLITAVLIFHRTAEDVLHAMEQSESEGTKRE